MNNNTKLGTSDNDNSSLIIPIDSCNPDETKPKSPSSSLDRNHQSTVTIEHRIAEKSDESSGKSFFSWIIKKLVKKEGKMIMMVVAYALIATVGGSFAYSRYSSLNKQLNLTPIVGEFELQNDELAYENNRLNKQINILSNEIETLLNQVNEMEQENEIFKNANNELQRNVTAISLTNERLIEQNNDFRDMNIELNLTNQRFETLIQKVVEENIDLRRSNDQMEVLNNDLNTEVNRLSVLTMNMTIRLEEFTSLNQELEYNVITLDNANLLLNDKIDALNISIQDLTQQNSKFQSLNADLISLVSFLDATGQEIEDSMEDVITYLSMTIDVYRSLALRDLEIEYQTSVRNFAYELNIFHGNEDFLKRPNSPIKDRYKIVRQFLNTRVLSTVCADLNDFENYMFAKNDIADDKNAATLTLHQILNALEGYVALLHDFYFPDGEIVGETSISIFDWERANFHCEELPSNLTYSFF